MWRWALLPLLGVLLVLHYAAFVGWGDLLHPTAACADDDSGGGWELNRLGRSSSSGGGGGVGGVLLSPGWLQGSTLLGTSMSPLRGLLRSAAEAVLAWMLGVGAVQVPALVALFLAFGACVMQVRGGEGGGAGQMPAAGSENMTASLIGTGFCHVGF